MGFLENLQSCAPFPLWNLQLPLTAFEKLLRTSNLGAVTPT